MSDNRISFDGRGIQPNIKHWTLQGFESYDQYLAYCNAIIEMYAGSSLRTFLEKEQSRVNGDLTNRQDSRLYGIPDDKGIYNKLPTSYADAMNRTDFLYWDKYEKIKEKMQKQILEKLAKTSVAEAMKDKMVFNDMELGDFVYDRAAMGLQPELFYYSLKHKRILSGEELDVTSAKYALVIETGDAGENLFYFKPDRSKVVLAVRVEKDDNEIEYVEVQGEQTLDEASSMGVLSATSDVKKSYLYKQKQPRLNNAIRLVIGLTRGGYTNWDNDFYGGVAAGIVIETLESLGYVVSVDLAFGGGRCAACGKRLNTPDGTGRRYFTMNVKRFDENTDMNKLLYMICDPSFHTVKLLTYINCFFKLYGDEMSVAQLYWHGIEKEDIITPIGAGLMTVDMGLGNSDIMYYLIHRVAGEADVQKAVLDIVLNAENENLKLKEKAFTYMV
jgi:hypothetical protein